jgi:hypothetical protein
MRASHLFLVFAMLLATGVAQNDDAFETTLRGVDSTIVLYVFGTTVLF